MVYVELLPESMWPTLKEDKVTEHSEDEFTDAEDDEEEEDDVIKGISFFLICGFSLLIPSHF